MISKILAPLLLLLTIPAFASPSPHPSRTRLQACKVPGDAGEVDALCGLYPVWENRAAKTGRKIRLNVVVLPARSPNPKPDPVFFLAGGPGQPATTGAGFLAEDELRKDRDLVLIDQRGTGDPDRLFCSAGGREGDLQSYLGEMFPVEAIRQCRETLEKNADLTLYTSDLAIDDFDEIRAWLGYDKVNLVGGSYGTRAAQVYMKRHPGSVRTVVLNGVAPMDEPLSISHAANGQRSLDLLLGWCEADAACHGAFPEIRADWKAMIDRLDQGPVTVEVEDRQAGKRVAVKLPKNVIVDGVRWALYGPETGATLPLMIHQAAKGDFGPLGQASVDARLGAINGITLGVLLSVTCAEDIPYIDPNEVAARTAGTFLGDYRVRQQMAACSVWPKGTPAPGHREAIHSDLPVLLISGERDPVTPPAFAERAAPHLTHGVRVLVPWGAHGGSTPCVEKLQRDLIERGTTAGLDTSCVAKIERLPFALK